MLRLIALAAVAAGTACGGDATEVVARFHVDERLGERAHGLRIRAFDADGTVVYDMSRPGSGALPLAFPVPVVFRPGDDASTELTAEATLLGPDGDAMIELTFDARYVDGERREVALCFESACRGLGCDRCEAGACAARRVETVAFGAAEIPAACRTSTPLDAAAGDAAVGDAMPVDAMPIDSGSVDGGGCRCECGDDACVSGRCVPARPVTEVTTGTNHSCAVAAGRAYCWGDNADGKLGLGVVGGTRTTPVDVGLAGVTRIAAGRLHSCAVADDVYCWGNRFDGRLALMDGSPEPSPVRSTGDLGSTPWTLRAGRDHTCAFEGGTLRCWGYNGSGQVSGPNPNETYPRHVGGETWATAATGRTFSCATSSAGELFCWGTNDDGALANASVALGTRLSSPRASDSTARFVRLALGGTHGCAVTGAGELFCWGNDASGQSGGAGRTPARLGTASDWTGVGAGLSHSCGVRSDALWCWGSNARGQLGSEGGDSATPRPIASGHRWAMVDGGDAHTCAATDTGLLYCWGANDAGQVSGPGPLDVTSPRRVCFP